VIQIWLAQSGLSKHTSGIEQLLKFFPLAAIGCAVTSYMVIYASARSRSRQIDWTDSHLIMEYSGPLSLALKWSAITSVKQDSQWELFHGKQPLFIIKTQEDNEFKLRLSDISHKHNIGEFFSLIKTNAPAAELNVDSSFASDNSYTELWLKYFSAPSERERTGLLKEGMLLDEGRYRVMGTIGGGGQGTAYLATFDPTVAPAVYDEDWQPDLLPEEAAAAPESGVLKQSHHIMQPDQGLYENAEVVLKEYVLPVHRGHLTAERTADKLKAEAKILQKLQHPQIVNLLDAFIEDYRGYLVLEYVAGESLKSLVERLGPQPESAVIDWALQVCSILHYLHSLTPPVVHRDITPDNLLLQEDGTIKIVDFNVAYQVDSSATATVVGKHAYIPAEQFRGKPTPQSDVYALGGTIFYLLTAREPEPITESHPKEISERVTTELDSIVGKATRHSQADRYADVNELSSALSSLLK
jgi:tRNA A-37 threonylcarbamoyl transferase component Bud32